MYHVLPSSLQRQERNQTWEHSTGVGIGTGKAGQGVGVTHRFFLGSCWDILSANFAYGVV